MAMRTKVVHVSSVHPRNDIRVFLKMSLSAASAGHDVAYVVADGKGDAVVSGVRILDVGRPTSRANRMLHAARRVVRVAAELDADLYHLHDPELHPWCHELRGGRARVVFDSHEDVPKQILGKPYLHRTAAMAVSAGYAALESTMLRQYDGLIGATPSIAKKLSGFHKNVELINNFPLASELASDIEWSAKRDQVAYVGSISRIRGALQVVRSLETLQSGARLNLVGPYSDQGLEEELMRQPGWRRVNALGQLGRAEVRDVLSSSLAGLVTFLAAPNHIDAQPNKMFEYMSAGIPVISSDFPVWREIVDGTGSGICVDPTSERDIGGAIDALTLNPARARELGERGRRAVARVYNWGIEEGKLLHFYDDLLSGRGGA
ncbi:MAG: glycosyltransferase [Gemmatimonadota bacterium]|nr:glycosyltransferase [Gemmatimonadota bacterium]